MCRAARTCVPSDCRLAAPAVCSEWLQPQSSRRHRRHDGRRRPDAMSQMLTWPLQERRVLWLLCSCSTRRSQDDLGHRHQ
jgi:hypothetical protein